MLMSIVLPLNSPKTSDFYKQVAKSDNIINIEKIKRR